MAKAFPAHLKPGHYQKNLIYEYSDLSVDKKNLTAKPIDSAC